ncbi:MAG: mechanosensitive ion channel [bacterium]|nr:mechanosensitive ion channel [bacterium]
MNEYINNITNFLGIKDETLNLIIYSILAILIITLISKIAILINLKTNKNEKKLYTFNKKTKIAKLLLTMIVLLIIWEKQLTNIITFISFIGAAATLAMRDIIVNFLAGIYITISKPFKLEDRIEVGTTIGDVVNINSLNFEILEVAKKEDGEQSTGIIVQVPNSKVFTEEIKNYTKAFKYIWSELSVKIKLDSDLVKNKKTLYDIVNSNDIVKKIPKKMKVQLNEAIGDYRIYYNNLEPIIYTKLSEEYVTLTIRYLAHPKKARHIESQIWNKIYEEAQNKKLDLYKKE